MPDPTAYDPALPRCAACQGTGKWVLRNSWFLADGHRRKRCGICAGTGRSSFNDPETTAQQAALRAEQP
jgi:hypothetical protein